MIWNLRLSKRIRYSENLFPGTSFIVHIFFRHETAYLPCGLIVESTEYLPGPGKNLVVLLGSCSIFAFNVNFFASLPIRQDSS